MLTIKNGRIYAEEFSFTLPEGMSFYYDSGIELRDCLQFISADKKTILDVRVVNPVPLGTLEAISKSEVFIPTSEIFSVNRGGLKGKAIRDVPQRKDGYRNIGNTPSRKPHLRRQNLLILQVDDYQHPLQREVLRRCNTAEDLYA